MDIPRAHPNWTKLVEGKIDYQFKLVSASLMMSLLVRQYKHEPTPAKMSESIDELVGFCQKFEGLLKDDLKSIFN